MKGSKMQGKYFDIPVFEWFSNGGKYSGCKRKDGGGDFNYRITPGEKLSVDIWYGVYCFEKSEPADRAEFNMSAEGLEGAVGYINNALEKSNI
jgi:hypothetical protein